MDFSSIYSPIIEERNKNDMESPLYEYGIFSESKIIRPTDFLSKISKERYIIMGCYIIFVLLTPIVFRYALYSREIYGSQISLLDYIVLYSFLVEAFSDVLKYMCVLTGPPAGRIDILCK